MLAVQEELYMAKTELGERKSPSGKKNNGGRAKGVLRSVVGTTSADSLLDLANRLGLADLVIGQVKAKIEGLDTDDVLDEVTEYLRRNPEVLVVTLGAVTIATGLVVWLNNRREWDGDERRTSPTPAPRPVSSSPGRVRRAGSSRSAEE
jgi:hypothetical protein